MKNILLFIIFISVSAGLWAQSAVEKGLQSIAKSDAQTYMNVLANDSLKGRRAGSPGGQIAAEYIVAQLQKMGIKPIGNSYYQSFSKTFKSWKTGKSIKSDKPADTTYTLDMKNIFGMIKGKNSNEYVIVGAHYDHVGVNSTLKDDTIFNGADDNASGTIGVLQIAQSFLASGQQPERNVIFAFWDGEEMGLLGSKYYVDTCEYLDKIKGYVNLDMIGRSTKKENPGYVCYYYTQTNTVFKNWIDNSIATYKLKLKPEYKALAKPRFGSDNYWFSVKKIPIIWYFTGIHPDYHKVSDEVDKIDWDKMEDIVKAAFISIWNFANEKSY